MKNVNMVQVAKDLVSNHVREEHRSKWENLPESKQGSAKKWFAKHDGKQVDLIQVSVDAEGNLSQGWAPGPREVDASMASKVLLGGSSRDYKGMVVEAANDDMLIASAPWGESRQMMLYRVA